MQHYSKMIAALIGNVVAIAAVFLASISPLAACVGEGDAQVCTILGLSTAEITAAVMMVLNTYFVWQFPANDPS